MESKIANLEKISGLKVIFRKEKNAHVFVFRDLSNKKTINSVYTYREAKIFAKGFKLGKEWINEYFD